jgi:hypothetical protein
MKKFLMIFGALALVGAIAVAGALGWAAYRASALDEESRAFVDDAAPAIARKWNRQELLNRAAPELKAEATPGQLDLVFDTANKLGAMYAYVGAKGGSTMSYTAVAGGTVTAHYLAKVRCQNGDAIFDIGLVKRDGHWFILTFHVTPMPDGSPVHHT